jgi:hypothetical protein
MALFERLDVQLEPLVVDKRHDGDAGYRPGDRQEGCALLSEEHRGAGHEPAIIPRV